MRQTNVIDRTSDEIEVWLAASEQVISRIRTEQMALLREAARRQLPLADGCRSLAEWAAGRMDMSTPAARTLSSTAQRLAGLPLIEEAAAAGNLSYERTVEVARLATADAQGETLDEVRHLDIGGLRRRAAQRRRLTRSDERAIAEAEHVVLRPNLDESRWDIWGTVGGYHGRVIDKALTVRGDQLPTPPEGMRVPLGKRKADALVSVCQDSLDETGPAGGSSPPLVTVFVDAAEASREGGETSAFIEAGPRVGPDTLARVLCAGSVELLARTEDGTPLAIGEAARPTEAPPVRPGQRRGLHGRCMRLAVPAPTPPPSPVGPGRPHHAGKPHHPVLVAPPRRHPPIRIPNRPRHTPRTAPVPGAVPAKRPSQLP